MTIKKSVIAVCLGIGFLLQTNLPAQVNTGIMPDSYFDNKTLNENIPAVRFAPPDMSRLQRQDAEDERDGVAPKIGCLLPADGLTPATAGAWQQLSNGTNVWRLALSSQGAQACVVHFNRMNLAPGARLFVYNPDGSVILGPYTHEDNPDGGPFAIGMVYGPEAIVEYVLPKTKALDNTISALTDPDLEIGYYTYVYRDAIDLRATSYGASDDCEVNVNCSEGDNWRVQQRGVALIYSVDGMYAYFCSGSLVNNTANDGTPYFLTADHCGGAIDAKYFRSWMFYFNYESTGCANARPTNQTIITGCTRVARSPLDGGSDFLLLKLNTTAEKIAGFNGVYNGWTTSTTASTSGVGIHHPAGDIKKISTYTNRLTSGTYRSQDEGTGLTNAHWVVRWAATANGHGVTEGGSSGSPLFNSDGLIVGTLSGGSSYCTLPTQTDLYGKMSSHWNRITTSDTTYLQPWLDPAGTATTCNYYDTSAEFNVSPAEYTFPAAASSADFAVKASTSTEAWTATTDATWLHISPETGVGGGQTTTMTVSVDENAEAGERTATITLAHAGQTKTVTIAQSGTDNQIHSFSYDFEACTDFAVDDFAPCTTVDRDGLDTYGMEGVDFANQYYAGAFIAFNPSATTPSLAAYADMVAYQGDKYGACFASIVDGSVTHNDDWFITPQIHLQANPKLTFYAKSVTDQYGLERFNVLVSEKTNDPDDFVLISQAPYTQAPTTWTKYTFNLSDYTDKAVYVAIQCVSADAFAFMIDDILVESEPRTTLSSVEQEGRKITVSPTVVMDRLDVQLPENNAQAVEVRISDLAGRTVVSTVLMQSGSLQLGHLAAGVYLLRAGDETVRFIKK